MNESIPDTNDELRIVMYVSRSTESVAKGALPPSLVSIITASRKKNIKEGISGVLSYSDGYFLQAIEGNDGAIEALIEKIKKDGRNKNLTVLVDTHSSTRYFDGKPLKLEPALESNDYFKRFVQDRFDKFSGDSITPKSVIEHIINNYQTQKKDEIVSTDDEQYPFSGYELKLNAWPRFDSKLPPRMFMELCALISQPVAYPILAVKNPYDDEDQLNKVLGTLNEKGLLTLNKLLSPPLVERPASDSFFFKMKNLLGRIR